MGPLFLTLLLAELPERLSMEFVEEPGGCALDARVPQAIGRFLPRLTLVRGMRGDGTWRLVVASRPSEVTIELTDDRGVRSMTRTVPAPVDGCAATADGIGLILERHLRDLGYEASLEALPPVATATRAPDPPPPPPPPPPVATSTGTASATTGVSLSGFVSLDGLIALPLGPAGVRFGGGLSVGLDVSFFRATVRGLFLSPGLSPAPVEEAGLLLGSYSVLSIPAFATVGGCGRFGAAAICGGLGGGVELIRGAVNRRDPARLFGVEARWIVTGIVAATVSLDYVVYDPLFLRVGATGLYRPDPARFAVSGGDVSAYEDSTFTVLFDLSIGVLL